MTHPHPKEPFMQSRPRPYLIQCQYQKCDAASVMLYACKGCKARFYCGSRCQRQDWDAHRTICVSNNHSQAVLNVKEMIRHYDAANISALCKLFLGNVLDCIYSKTGMQITTYIDWVKYFGDPQGPDLSDRTNWDAWFGEQIFYTVLEVVEVPANNYPHNKIRYVGSSIIPLDDLGVERAEKYRTSAKHPERFPALLMGYSLLTREACTAVLANGPRGVGFNVTLEMFVHPMGRVLESIKIGLFRTFPGRHSTEDCRSVMVSSEMINVNKPGNPCAQKRDRKGGRNMKRNGGN